jgi:hypothetical protein
MNAVGGVRRWLENLLGRTAKLAFTLTCWVTALALLAGVLLQIAGPTDVKVLASLLAGFLGTLFLAAYGTEVANRIKKVGPLELFEAQAKARELEAAELPTVKDIRRARQGSR